MEVKLKISKKIFLLSFLLLSEWGFLFASFWEEESYLGDLGTVVITGTRIPRSPSLVLRNVTIIDPCDINSFPVHSVTEVLKYAPGVDLRERGPYGVQADLGMRGANFHQVLILVDGLQMNDPQTAHHNLDLPINLPDLERIEILHGHGSSVYGADAFGGVVNFITKNPEESKVVFDAFAGGNGTRGGTFYLSNRLGRFGTRLSLGAEMSDGYRFDTDFRNFCFSSNSRMDISRGTIGFSFGYLEKEFGANGFYGDWPSREWTNTILGSIKGQIEKWKNLAVESRLYFRQHEDKFVGDITRSDSYVNFHTTYVYGSEVQFRTRSETIGEIVLGAEVAKEELRSTRLGNHSNVETAIYAEYGVSLGRSFGLNPGIRLDHNSEWGWQFSPAMNTYYHLSPKVKLFSSLGKSFRTPDYTELYYWSPKNVGNPRLVIEEAWSYELGGDFDLNTWLRPRMTLLVRDERNLIDWVKRDSLSPWQAVKIGRVLTYGMEALFEVELNSSSRLSLGYTFLKSESEELENYISKYSLGHPQHQVSLGIGFPLFLGILQNVRGRYRQSSNERGYFILDSRLSKSLGQLEFHLVATNLLNISYEEIPGVPMPGISFAGGVKLEF